MQDNIEITPEEARAELQRRQTAKSQQDQSVKEKPSLLRGLLDEQKGWMKGLGIGGAQSIGDIGASVGNIPASLIEKLSGRRPYNIPHPHLLNDENKGFGETFGQEIGKDLPKLSFETMIARRFAPLGGRSALARIGIGTASGAGAGAAASEDHRAQGLWEGGLTGLLGGVATEFPLFQSQAAAPYKRVNKAIAENNIGGFHLSPETHKTAKDLMNFSELSPEKKAIKNFLQESKQGSYGNIHDFQSHMASLSRDLMKEGKHRMAKRVSDLRGKILSEMKLNLKGQGYGDVANDYERGQDLYRRHHAAKPYIKDLLKYSGLGSAFGGAAYLPYKILSGK